MGELNPRIVDEVAEHIKKEVLTAVPARIDQLSTENVEILRSKLHILHYYCLQKGFDSDITNMLAITLETSQGFWELLEDNESTLTDLKETYKMRWLDLGSGVLTELEEIMSGEESFRDVVVNSIAILLGWKADTVWVDMAKEDRRLVPKIHMVRLRDKLWQFISEYNSLTPVSKGESLQNISGMTLEKAAEIGEKMDLLLQFMAGDDMPVAARVMFLSQLYILLLRLSISKILTALEGNRDQSPDD